MVRRIADITLGAVRACPQRGAGSRVGGRMPRRVHVIVLAAAVLENFGYRQLMTLWRAIGLFDALRGKTGWGAMERRGFKVSET